MRKSVDVFVPRIRVRSRRQDRRMMIRVPLFPGYVFVKSSLHPQHHLDILKTVGVVRLIGTKAGPVPVPTETVDSLKIMVAADEPLTTGSRFKKGDRIIVVNGPFTGVVGTFDRYRGKGRVVVDIEALGQFAGASVSESDIEKLPDLLP